ncbi:disease resistance rpp13-like protein 1-like [Trifolium pratense]|uniref:Disease resistance rpp13-like protein 1-like n=2 Tax=Trifolium pratense TaxID=57577 RepID=A0A2K3MWG6_TRIPR|nr:disease resistance rpp13-like protein 1-like [Trifolium pratense]
MVDMLSSFISAILQVLLDRIANPDLVDFFRGNHLDEALLEKLKMLLLSVITVLNDAEEKQFVDPLVKEWVDRLKNVAYDADDVLDEIATKAIQDKMDPRFQTTLNQVKDYASSLNPFSERVQSKIGRIVERLKSILEHKNILGLKEGGVGKSLSFGSATTSLVNEHRVYGRDGDREKIIDFLLAGDSNGEGVPVVAIVGMGGIGKTTLAQILYNDERVRNHFQSRSWAFVSDTSNVYEMTKKVFESFTLSHSNISDLNILQIKLKDRLARKRFLLVLDGFQNENFLDWDILQRPFLSGNYGSRIIVTTRSQSVATLIRADLTHSLSLLSHDDTWKLFASHAFKSGNPNDELPILAQIGQKIVKKCNGLPLAAKALGSLLRTKVDEEEWKCVCYSRIWELPSDKCSILPALRLSYSHLPSHLKRCFTYCSIFPKGFEIQKQNLIYLWMAEGILPPQKTKKRMEDVGEEFFQELLSRSFFYRSTYHISHYMMHDLIHDVAQFVAGEFYYNLDDSNPRKVTFSVRHLSYLQGIYDDPEKFEIFSEFKELRTFIPFKFSYFVYSSSITSMVSILLPKLKRLRVLSLSHYPITKLPDSIGNLLHLRYLDLSYTGIECLPDSISTLYNLETLLLSSCRSLTMLPENMSNLVNLRQLDISGCTVTQMPAKFGKLKSLQVLTSFVIGNKRGSKISELGELSNLHGALLIGGLQNVVDPTEAFDANLKRKKYLREVEFKWTTLTHDQESETNVLDMLEPHKNVERLKIQNFGGNKLPNWLGSSSFSNMVFLHLANCENCKSLPSLGQLSSLTELCISNMKSLQKVGQEFYGNGIESFKLLKILKFEDMPNWEEWSPNRFEENGQFPSLRELYIERCPKLTTKLPDHLPSLDKLVITTCQALTNPMPCVPRLRELVLTGCDALSSLSKKMMQGNKCLQFMVISNCSSLVNISMDSLPSTLRSLEIYECRNLQLFHSESSMQQSQCYSALEKLHLKCSCDSLISFPLLLFNKLEDLHIQDCSNLEFISPAPNSLPCFRKLKLKQCSKLAQLPEGGLHAPKLESLSISKCVDFSSEISWGLQTMTSLTSLRISGLPSLTSLEHTGVQYLTSLKSLKIKDCANLGSLPLDKLVISLSHLTIRACPLLKVLYEKDIGQYWSMVSLIPFRIIED